MLLALIYVALFAPVIATWFCVSSVYGGAVALVASIVVALLTWIAISLVDISRATRSLAAMTVEERARRTF